MEGYALRSAGGAGPGCGGGGESAERGRGFEGALKMKHGMVFRISTERRLGRMGQPYVVTRKTSGTKATAFLFRPANRGGTHGRAV